MDNPLQGDIETQARVRRGRDQLLFPGLPT